ncbi:saccharopine dehydrogenase C-terminal domain-containing protein [Zooshikella harenae]|uniref:Saccharopine dehydrogenase-like C-terminal domain-containing protein n=1 Tax=Zooshikella harenae TaxID=2827238 RepID=A0ABS5ZEW1_9GAMM|nr:saccharopine dehydrogenase C-terminal domain-containing protein [Zooshikella harenae]MBU2711507.1 hypothetical protein [Zooshikella harenae]
MDNKHIAIIGCGAMGKSIASLLSIEKEVAKLLLCDLSDDALHAIEQSIKNISDIEVIMCNNILHNRHLLADVDAIVLSLAWPLAWRYIQDLAGLKKPIVSITRPNYSVFDSLQDFSQCPLSLPIGLEPGLTEIVIDLSLKKFGKLDDLLLYCGGFVDPPPGHFPYRCAFGDSVPIKADEAFYIENNNVRQSPKYDHVEEIFINELGFLEAYRDGLMPWIADKYKDLVTNLEQKTLRHRGFCSQVRNLKQLGFLSDQSIKVDDHNVDILAFTRRVLAQRKVSLSEVERDITLLKALAKKGEDKSSLTITSSYCSKYNLTSMGMMTASVLTHYLLAFIDHIGIDNKYYHPHEYYHDDSAKQSLFNYMRSLGVHIEGDLIT